MFIETWKKRGGGCEGRLGKYLIRSLINNKYKHGHWVQVLIRNWVNFKFFLANYRTTQYLAEEKLFAMQTFWEHVPDPLYSSWFLCLNYQRGVVICWREWFDVFGLYYIVLHCVKAFSPILTKYLLSSIFILTSFLTVSFRLHKSSMVISDISESPEPNVRQHIVRRILEGKSPGKTVKQDI